MYSIPRRAPTLDQYSFLCFPQPRGEAMKHILLLALVMVAGCATTEKYEESLRSWVGSSPDQLISQWGPPDSSFTTGTSTYLTYSQGRTYNVPGVAPTYQTTCSFGVCTTNAVGGSPGYTINSHCKTTFTVQGNQITSWRWEGNSCKAR